MNDMNDKIRERWQDRRRKGYNWTKLLVMLAVLVGIIFAMNRLNKTATVMAPSTIEIIDSTAVDSLFEGSGE
ncbi:MAG: hypothetical protein U1B83_04425 [Candidatus Cloacimonadaceae bacterium]|nr:hypothetical protein [Candidatus Cloacimonadaceae bacterium]